MSLAYHRLAGAAGTTITCPLEVVKTRLQVWQAEFHLARGGGGGGGLFPPKRAPCTASLHKINVTPSPP